MFEFGLNDYKAFHPANDDAYGRGYRWLVEFSDGAMGVVCADGRFYGGDRLYSNPPYTDGRKLTRRSR